jgi:5-methylthioadenosine/S-adenosylhomocysteine deaminase
MSTTGARWCSHVHDLGLLDERMMVIHAIWIDAEDIALLARAGCTVAHNPVCNLRLGSGVMPWRALHAKLACPCAWARTR